MLRQPGGFDVQHYPQKIDDATFGYTMEAIARNNGLSNYRRENYSLSSHYLPSRISIRTWGFVQDVCDTLSPYQS